MLAYQVRLYNLVTSCCYFFSMHSGNFFEHHDRHYQFDGKINYINVRPGIGDPAIFHLPEACKNL